MTIQSSTAAATPGPTLLINGSQEEAEMYGEWFRALGHRVTLTTTAADAYRQAVELRPVVVVTEISLNGTEDGLSLTRRIKRNEQMRDLPVVIVTGLGSDRYRDAALEAGCDLFILKPCLPDELLARLSPFL
jgi:DNA-binding response OmpR family regulator